MGRRLRNTVFVAALSGSFIALAASPAAANGWRGDGAYGSGWAGAGNSSGSGYNPYGGGWAGAETYGSPQRFYNNHNFGYTGHTGYGHCYFVDQAVRDDWGNLVDVRPTRVCN